MTKWAVKMAQFFEILGYRQTGSAQFPRILALPINCAKNIFGLGLTVNLIVKFLFVAIIGRKSGSAASAKK